MDGPKLQSSTSRLSRLLDTARRSSEVGALAELYENGTRMNAKLADVGDAYVQVRFAADPVLATMRGVPGFNHELADPSRQAAAGLANALRELETELATVDVNSLTPTEKVAHSALRTRLRDEQATAASVAAIVSISDTFFGRFSGLLAALPSTPLPNEQAAADYLTRLSKIGTHFHAAGVQHREGAASGLVATKRGIAQAGRQIDAYLAGPISADPFLRPAKTMGQPAWTAAVAKMVEASVRPGLFRHRELLAGELALTARSDKESGICHVPGGAAAYLAAVRQETTTDLTPAQLHSMGLAIMAELRAEMAERGQKALGESDPHEVINRLRHDRTLRYQSREQIIATATSALREAEAKLSQRFHEYDLAPCVVKEMHRTVARGGVLGYYEHPTPDGLRPGAHVVNTYRPQTRTRFEYAALAFHESVPGHHVQIAKALSLRGIPQFQRLFGFNAHEEGWGLYSERLADEMDLYPTELDRLGMVSFDAWRASRLVVDTGLHYQGWSRKQAVDYMLANTALSKSNIINEVDRYVAKPGQALAYMVGRLRITELRKQAEEAMGARFDIRQFHDLVLGSGSLPLDTLSELIGDWIHPPAS